MKTIASKAECPACGQVISVWAINPRRGTREDASPEKCDAVGVFPPPSQRARKSIDGVNLLSDRLRRQYLDMLATFNAGVWSATATQCRVTLEGVVRGLLPKATGALASQIQQLSQWPDLGKPLVTLSHALRQGGNIGAHFDEVREADQTLAEAMLDLVEYLLVYVYTLPALTVELDNKIAALGTNAGGAATS